MKKTSAATILSRLHACAVLPLVASLLLCRPALASTDLHLCEQDVLHGRADQAIAGLRLTVMRNPGDARAHLLLCRAFLSEGRATEAAEECQTALNAGLSGDSDAQDWAGRAFGRKAEHAGPLAGLKLASAVRSAFGTAHRLDPLNPAAANDLGEFYIEAPFLVGGGVEKASALADAVQSTLPEVAHRLRALLAQKREDPAAAEREFLAAVAVTYSPGALVDLATFYVRQREPAKATAAARRAIARDRLVDADVVDAAAALAGIHQTALAMPALRSYLDHGRQTDQAPAFRAHTLIGEILASQGDREGARKEFQEALTLAANYAPAQKGLASL